MAGDRRTGRVPHAVLPKTPRPTADEDPPFAFGTPNDGVSQLNVMHLAFVIPSLGGGGGAERALLAVARGLAARGHAVDLLLFDPQASSPEEIPAAARLFVAPPAARGRGRAAPANAGGNGSSDTPDPQAATSGKQAGFRRIERCRPVAPRSVRKRGRFARLLARGGPRLALNKVLDLLLRDPAVFRHVGPIADYARRERPDCLLPVLPRAHLATLAASARSAEFPPVVPCLQLPLTIERRTRRRLHRELLPLAAHTVAVSDGLAAELASTTGVPPDRVTTIHNPFVRPPLDERRRPPVHPWLESEGADGFPVVLAAGRLTRQKNFPLLIRAFRRVRSRRPVRLVILGAGPERTRLERLVASLGLQDAVSLPGWTGDPLACMARADLFVMSSRWEGLPLALIEALACGCPVVSTDCRHGPAEILDGGAFGRLVPPEDEAALAEAMERTLDAPPDRDLLVRRAACFSEDRTVDAWERLLAAVCAHAGARYLRPDGNAPDLPDR